MGAMLDRPVESTVIERRTSKSFRVGVSELNGWRNNMEDAHLIHICDDWGFFGVFDGHGGEACSKYVAEKMGDELKSRGCPENDDAVRKMLFRIDDEFLEWVKEDKQTRDSGSTATMCIVHKPAAKGAKHRLRVINAGDSRVLLGRRDGTIVEGNGTDQGLTTDHKPDNPIEKERIYRCGGTVEHAEGNVARVNGDLAVCRGFGDGSHKETEDPHKRGPENRPVTVDPELIDWECDETDFILLVCDGVSEGDFSNAQVVKLVAETLADCNDPGKAGKVVCHKAVERGSKDNVSCMVVLLDGGEPVQHEIDFEPGSSKGLSNSSYKTAYTAMAGRAGLTLEQALEKRYDLLNVSSDELDKLQKSHLGRNCDLEEELESFGKPAGEPGSNERSNYFSDWISQVPSDGANHDPGINSILSMLGGQMQMGKGDGKGGKGGPFGGGYASGGI